MHRHSSHCIWSLANPGTLPSKGFGRFLHSFMIAFFQHLKLFSSLRIPRIFSRKKKNFSSSSVFLKYFHKRSGNKQFMPKSGLGNLGWFFHFIISTNSSNISNIKTNLKNISDIKCIHETTNCAMFVIWFLYNLVTNSRCVWLCFYSFIGVIFSPNVLVINISWRSQNLSEICITTYAGIWCCKYRHCIDFRFNKDKHIDPSWLDFLAWIHSGFCVITVGKTDAIANADCNIKQPFPTWYSQMFWTNYIFWGWCSWHEIWKNN